MQLFKHSLFPSNSLSSSLFGATTTTEASSSTATMTTTSTAAPFRLNNATRDFLQVSTSSNLFDNNNANTTNKNNNNNNNTNNDNDDDNNDDDRVARDDEASRSAVRALARVALSDSSVPLTSIKAVPLEQSSLRDFVRVGGSRPNQHGPMLMARAMRVGWSRDGRLVVPLASGCVAVLRVDVAGSCPSDVPASSNNGVEPVNVDDNNNSSNNNNDVDDVELALMRAHLSASVASSLVSADDGPHWLLVDAQSMLRAALARSSAAATRLTTPLTDAVDADYVAREARAIWYQRFFFHLLNFFFELTFILCFVRHLVDALWGESRDKVEQSSRGPRNARREQRCRKLRFDRWLRTACASELDVRAAANSNNNSGHNNNHNNNNNNNNNNDSEQPHYLTRLFDLMCRHRIADAVALASEHGDTRLALLIGGAGGGASGDLRAQLTAWVRDGRREFIDARRWRILQVKYYNFKIYIYIYDICLFVYFCNFNVFLFFKISIILVVSW